MKIKRYIGGSLMLWLLLLITGNSYGGDWCVQVSSFRHLEGIKKDFQKVKTLKHAKIVKIKNLYSIRVGPFTTMPQAKEASQAVTDKFPGAFVRKCSNESARIIEVSRPPKAQIPIKQAEKSAGQTAEDPPLKTASAILGQTVSTDVASSPTDTCWRIKNRSVNCGGW